MLNPLQIAISPEDFFSERYGRMLEWSLHLTNGDRAAAEDLPLENAATEPAAQAGTPPLLDTVYAFDPHLKLPYSLQWSAAVEQPLGRDQFVSAAYVGNAGRRLLREAVQPLGEGFREVRLVTGCAGSDYHALQLQFQRRASRRRSPARGACGGSSTPRRPSAATRTAR